MTRATPMALADRRQAIVEATVPLLLAHGTQVSTREIAQAAGVAEGTIFRAFETKQNLLNEAILHALQVEAAAAQLAALDPARPLAELVHDCLLILTDEISRTRALTSLLSHPQLGGRGHCPMVDAGERKNRLRAAIANVLQPHADRVSVSPETAAMAILAMAFALSHQMAGHQTTTARELTDLVLHGIAERDQ